MLYCDCVQKRNFGYAEPVGLSSAGQGGLSVRSTDG